MKTPRTPRHNTGEEVGINIDGRPVPYQSGVLPKDFAKRLKRLKKASGLTWNAFADALGVDKKSVQRWSNGTEPCGGAYHSLMSLAPMIPGGVDMQGAPGQPPTFATARSTATTFPLPAATTCATGCRVSVCAAGSVPTSGPSGWRNRYGPR